MVKPVTKSKVVAKPAAQKKTKVIKKKVVAKPKTKTLVVKKQKAAAKPVKARETRSAAKTVTSKKTDSKGADKLIGKKRVAEKRSVQNDMKKRQKK